MASVFLGDLDDFIAPGQACVNPLFAAPTAAPTAAPKAAQAGADGDASRGGASMQLALEDDGILGAVDRMQVEQAKPDLIKASAQQTAKVSLDDCLACSGCVTSAETVLITQQSTGKLLDELGSRRHSLAVASISPQARASLADHFGLTPLETHARLATFLRAEGIHHLLDSSLAADFSLLEAGEEFVERYRGAAEGGGPPWVAPPHTVAVSSSKRYNLEAGREESVSHGSAQASALGPGSGVASRPTGGVAMARKRGRPGEGLGGGFDVEDVGLRDGAERAASGPGSVAGPRGSASLSPGQLLVLTSACPGWVCYAEKTAPEALPCMSTVKSPQQIMGTLAKRVFPQAWRPSPSSREASLPVKRAPSPGGTSTSAASADASGGAPPLPSPPSSVFHVAIAQCYDKKLEASRKDFQHEDMGGQVEVDLVLTTSELLRLVEERAAAHASSSRGNPGGRPPPRASVLTPTPVPVSPGDASAVDIAREFFRSLPPSDLSQPLGPGFPVGQVEVSADGVSLFGGVSGEGSSGGNSGGYLEYVFRYAAHRLFGKDLWERSLTYRQGRNADFRETSLEVDGEVVLCFAYAYGFRNIQSVLAKARRRKCPYHFVEVMACPSGCLNGGGQIKPAKEAPRETRDRVHRVSDVLRRDRTARSPHESPLVELVYRELLGGEPGGQGAKSFLHTTFHNVPKLELSNPHMSKW